MLNAIIRFSLRYRMFVIALWLVTAGLGAWQGMKLPIDVFPNLNRPRVVILTEAPGLAPEEVESLITIPLETSLNGATGVQAVRTSSAVGLSVVNVEFDWGTDIFVNRQIVTERIATVAESLPEGIRPQLAPISSLLGQISIVGMFSEQTERSKLFELPSPTVPELAALHEGRLSELLREAFQNHDWPLSDSAKVMVDQPQRRWFIRDFDRSRSFAIVRHENRLEVHRATDPMELRTLADWVVRQRLLTVPGVSQVSVMGGGRKQFQVLINPDLLRRFDVTLHDVERAVQQSNQNTTGGYLDNQGPNELLVRALGRLQNVAQLKDVVVAHRDGQSILLRQVAEVVEGPQVKRGDSAAFSRDDEGRFVGGAAVVLVINKQPDADTRAVTIDTSSVLRDLAASLPDDVVVVEDLYQQSDFIDLAIDNVEEALRDGFILVVINLFLFLMNFRTTFITLTAIPLSLVTTALVFHFLGLSINTMTLGGLAVAIGELVDDAIVDVENIYRRLRENSRLGKPKHQLLVVFQASVEVRNSIVYGTMIVVLVFLPLFALQGMEGRLFTPLGIAYIVSILSSLFVSLTVTPILSYWLLPAIADRKHKESWLLRWLQAIASRIIHLALTASKSILLLAAMAVAIAAAALWQLERDFLPPFNEGAVQINVMLPPGTSLRKSSEIALVVEQRLKAVPEITAFVRKSGRAELDEHVMDVNISEIIASLDPQAERGREEILQAIRDELHEIPGIVVSVEQPLAHLISHMLSGVEAHVAIKLYGDDLIVLRRRAKEMEAAIATVPGVTDLQVEQQIVIPQVQIDIDGDKLKLYGLTRGKVNEFIETAMQGRVVSEVLDGQRRFDLLVRFGDDYREDLDELRRLAIELPEGGHVKLSEVAEIRRGGGPNTINREQVQRRIVLQCNTTGRGLVDVVADIQRVLEPHVAQLPAGYFLEYGGQFESTQSATRTIGLLFGVSLLGMFLLLYTLFRSANLALQVMIALPMAFIGSVAALYVTDQRLTIAAIVGFISLCGIASRNGILLINHYLHLVRYEGESFTREMIARAGRERLAPVLMTALTSGIGLVPLALAAGQPGKEILYPVATVIIGGLLTSTALEFLVRPALFWKFGMAAAHRSLNSAEERIELVEESPENLSQTDLRTPIERID